MDWTIDGLTVAVVKPMDARWSSPAIKDTIPLGVNGEREITVFGHTAPRRSVTVVIEDAADFEQLASAYDNVTEITVVDETATYTNVTIELFQVEKLGSGAWTGTIMFERPSR